MVLLALLLQVAGSPMVPPPAKDRLDAAVAIWFDHPPSALNWQTSIDAAVMAATSKALEAVRIEPSSSIRANQNWRLQYDRMKTRMTTQLPRDWSDVDRRTGECIVEGIARAMTADELNELRRLSATGSGAKFWRTMFDGKIYSDCLAWALNLRATNDDYLALGLRPPRPPRQPNPRDAGNIVY